MLNELVSFSLFSKKINSKKDLVESYVDWILNKVRGKDIVVKALLPEKDIKERLISELNWNFDKINNENPFFGIPFGVKDLFNANGFETKCGSELPAKLFEGEEAEIVTKIKNLGGIVLGKTVTTEFAYFEPGPTKNPNNLNFTPGGSSSGSAAAVAAGMCPFALGTQTIGSVIRPAAYSGIVGFKPSLGRISTKGVVPFSETFDQIGFFTSNLADAKLVSPYIVNNWTKNEKSIYNLRICVPTGKYLEQADREVVNIFNLKVNQLKSAGFDVFEHEVFSEIEQINDEHRAISAFDIAKVHEPWFEEYKSLYRPKTVEIIENGRSLTKATIDEYLQNSESRKQSMQQLMKDLYIDVFISPATTTFAPKGLTSTGSPLMNLPWTYLGFPAVTFPIFRNSENLPLGIQLTSLVNTDEMLLDAAEVTAKVIGLNI